jgi:hypothetical protein
MPNKRLDYISTLYRKITRSSRAHRACVEIHPRKVVDTLWLKSGIPVVINVHILKAFYPLYSFTKSTWLTKRPQSSFHHSHPTLIPSPLSTLPFPSHPIPISISISHPNPSPSPATSPTHSFVHQIHTKGAFPGSPFLVSFHPRLEIGSLTFLSWSPCFNNYQHIPH